MKRDVLIVEDNEGDILLLQETLETLDCKWNHIILTDGEKAINYLSEQCGGRGGNCPDLIILDLNLPRKNGFEVLEYIKNHHSLKKIPTIIFSTSSSLKDISACYQGQANCYITKPVDIESYQKTIQSICSFWVETVKLP